MTILVEIGLVAATAGVAAVARRSAIRAGEAAADVAAERATANAEFGHPVASSQTRATARPRLQADMPPCHGELIVHEDGHQSCRGGRDDCWPQVKATYSHRRTRSCMSINHGCGECQKRHRPQHARHNY